jgi:hypothetical protein
MRVFIFISIILFCIYDCPAQQAILFDSSAIPVRSFSPEKMKAWQADKDFQYNRYKEPPKSLWQRFWGWFWNKIEDLLNTAGGSATFKTVFILLAVLIMGFFIYSLTGMSKAGLFRRNTGDLTGYAVTGEDIHSINFDQAIDEAIQNGNYRLAGRLLYLQSLKKLTDKNLINWQLNKTNVAYVQELQGSNYQHAFSNLTLQFESNWYGDMPIDKTEFTAVRGQFIQFNRQLV